MRMELSIKDDTELRAVVKDMIRGQVTRLIRDEDLVQHTITEHVKKASISTNRLEAIMVSETKNQIAHAFNCMDIKAKIRGMVQEEIVNQVKAALGTQLGTK